MLKSDEKITLIIIHDGRKWIASGDDLQVTGNSLAELDQLIKKKISDSGRFSKGSRVKVDLVFDFSTIPGWIRQYSPYYFNRQVVIEI